MSKLLKKSRKLVKCFKEIKWCGAETHVFHVLFRSFYKRVNDDQVTFIYTGIESEKKPDVIYNDIDRQR